MYIVPHILIGGIIVIMIILTTYLIYKYCTRPPTDDEELRKALNELFNGE